MFNVNDILQFPYQVLGVVAEKVQEISNYFDDFFFSFSRSSTDKELARYNFSRRNWDVFIPYGIKIINGNYFSMFTSVILPDSVTHIGERAFLSSNLLVSIYIPKNVVDIGDSVFKDCASLTSITIPHGVTRIGAKAFKGCSSLVTVHIPESVVDIGDRAFEGSSTVILVLPYIPNECVELVLKQSGKTIIAPRQGKSESSDILKGVVLRGYMPGFKFRAA
jgi:hypothetical protein